MISYKTEQVEQRLAETITCDVCKTTYDYEKDIMEIQEFHHIRFRGGYGSVFGDGAPMEADICQHCLKKSLGDCLRVGDELQ
jgi:hypothetical protein